MVSTDETFSNTKIVSQLRFSTIRVARNTKASAQGYVKEQLAHSSSSSLFSKAFIAAGNSMRPFLQVDIGTHLSEQSSRMYSRTTMR